MKKSKLISIISFIFIFIISINTTFASKPEPPQGVDEIIEALGEFEEAFEKEDWKESKTLIKELEVALIKTFGPYKDSVISQKTIQLTHILNNLDVQIDKKNRESVNKHYLLYQKGLYELLDLFDYEIPIVLSIIEKYANEEALEALENNKYEHVANEMTEIIHLTLTVRDYLVNKGIEEKDIKTLIKQSREVIYLCKTKDKEIIEEKIHKMVNTIKEFNNQVKKN